MRPAQFIGDGFAYLVIGVLAAIVIATAAKAPGERVSPDLAFREANR